MKKKNSAEFHRPHVSSLHIKRSSSLSPLLSRSPLPLREDDVGVGPDPDGPGVVVGEWNPRLAPKAGISLHLQIKAFTFYFI